MAPVPLILLACLALGACTHIPEPAWLRDVFFRGPCYVAGSLRRSWIMKISLWRKCSIAVLSVSMLNMGMMGAATGTKKRAPGAHRGLCSRGRVRSTG